VLTVGGNTVATLNSANFTTLQHGGSTSAKVATGNYSGNGVTTGRQLVAGFAAKYVMLWQEATGTTYLMVNTNASTRLVSSGNPTYETAVHLHASDGFTVGDGSDRGNNVAESYRWTAIG
jgi:hypothetical protein